MSSTEEKGIDSDTLKFIDSIIADSHQEVYFKGWLDITYLGNKKQRLVVITNFRMYVIKTGLLGRSLRQSFMLLHLKSMRAESNALTLFFDEDIPLMKELSHKHPGFTGEVTIEHTAVPSIATHILFACESIRYGRPPISVSIPQEWLATYKSPDPDEQDGILATYLAECDRVGIPQRVPVLDYFMTCFQIDDHMFDCRAALSFLDQPCQRDILAIAFVLRYTTWFTSFVCVDFPLKNEGALALATLFDVKTSIRKLVLVNTKIGKPAMVALAQRFANGLQDFEHIAICSNPIGNDGLAALVEGLQAFNKVPTTLLLSNNDISKAGIKPLTALLATSQYRTGLQVLDLSDNGLGKLGTDCLTAWLAHHDLVLEQLFLRRTDLEFDRIFHALNSNPVLIHKHLALFDMTGNKLTKKAVPELAQMLQTSKCLSCIVLNNCQVENKHLLEIFDAMFKNPNNLGFSLDLGNNDIGSKGAKDLQQFISTRIQENPKPLMSNGVIQWLNLSDNGLGNEGIALICRAFQATTIKSLKLDRNYKTGIFSKANEASDALAQFVANTPSLTEFSIAGDDNTFYLQKYLLPLLAAIKQHQSLAYIDVSNNRIGDEGIQLVAEALTKQTALRGLNVEGSRMTLTGLSILDRAIRLNRSVVDMQMPVQDVDRIIKSLGNRPKEIEEIQNVIRSIDDVMDRNEQLANYNAQLAEQDDIPDYAARYASGSMGATPAAQSTTCDISSVESKEQSGAANNSSMMLRSGSGLGPNRGGKRMSVIADSYENMIATLKSSKTHRKMQARELGLLAQGVEAGPLPPTTIIDSGATDSSSTTAYVNTGAESDDD